MTEADVDALRTEVAELRTQLDAARDATQRAEGEAGRLRGELAEMHVQLIRARQDQERFQRVFDLGHRARERFDRVAGRLRRVFRR